MEEGINFPLFAGLLFVECYAPHDSGIRGFRALSNVLIKHRFVESPTPLSWSHREQARESLIVESASRRLRCKTHFLQQILNNGSKPFQRQLPTLHFDRLAIAANFRFPPFLPHS